MVVIGDPSQVDLERNQKSGLVEAVNTLKNLKSNFSMLFGASQSSGQLSKATFEKLPGASQS